MAETKLIDWDEQMVYEMENYLRQQPDGTNLPSYINSKITLLSLTRKVQNFWRSAYEIFQMFYVSSMGKLKEVFECYE